MGLLRGRDGRREWTPRGLDIVPRLVLSEPRSVSLGANVLISEREVDIPSDLPRRQHMLFHIGSVTNGLTTGAANSLGHGEEN
jgi:hypothetical protein